MDTGAKMMNRERETGQPGCKMSQRDGRMDGGRREGERLECADTLNKIVTGRH